LQAHFFSGRKFWRLPFTSELFINLCAVRKLGIIYSALSLSRQPLAASVRKLSTVFRQLYLRKI
jgi:hypothetical protein